MDLDDQIEEMFLAAVHEGNIATFMDILQHKEDNDLDLEYKDINGQTALQAAIAEGYAGTNDKRQFPTESLQNTEEII